MRVSSHSFLEGQHGTHDDTAMDGKQINQRQYMTAYRDEYEQENYHAGDFLLKCICVPIADAQRSDKGRVRQRKRGGDGVHRVLIQRGARAHNNK
jgi:hypothetical protein